MPASSISFSSSVTGRVLLAGLPAALFSLHAKGVLLENEGRRIAARHLGLASDELFTPLDDLSFYRLDLAMGLLLLPVVLVLLTRPFPARFRPMLAAVVGAALLIVQYVQIRSYLAIGRYLSIDLATSALQRARENPEDILSYDSPTSLIKMGLLLGVVFLSASGLPRPARTALGAATARFRRFLPRPRGAAVFVSVLLVAILSLPWMSRVATTSYHRGILAESLRPFLAGDEASGEDYAGLAPEALLAEYRTLAHSPEPLRGGPRWGVARGCHVLLFIMETTPSACLPLDAPLPDMPVLAGLREGALVAASHHSTYPYTNRAVFSLFTSQYPSTRTHGFLPVAPDARLPGLARSLAESGYHTVAYFPNRQTFASDELMFAALGVEAQRYPTGAAAEAAERQGGWRRILARDEAALDLLVEDIAGWGAGGPVLAAFLPQMGHGPWEDVAGTGVTDMLRRGRNVAVLHDRMLGRVMEALRRAGQAERTVVVVTADHGLRTRAEYPALPGGSADSISFHVPLLVRAPGAAVAAERISWVTSHIDVAPTLLDLLGVETGRETEQGLPVWDERLAGRITFLFGRHYSGVDAYYSDGAYAMWNHPSAMGYGPRGSLHFPPDEARPEESSRAEVIRARITRMAALQDALLRADAERLARPAAPPRRSPTTVKVSGAGGAGAAP